MYHCIKWIMVRMKYNVLETYKPLKEIFKDGKEAELKCITNFLKEIKMEI